MEAIALRLKAIALRLEAIAIRLESCLLQVGPSPNLPELKASSVCRLHMGGVINRRRVYISLGLPLAPHRGWAAHKKSWCCQHQDIACAEHVGKARL